MKYIIKLTVSDNFRKPLNFILYEPLQSSEEVQEKCEYSFESTAKLLFISSGDKLSDCMLGIYQDASYNKNGLAPD